ncbi:MAG: addiction module toxin RelE [Pseudomonadota bacterium]|nr:MAG: addiction module toxin RelE [Pseudomonadota bacterium]
MQREVRLADEFDPEFDELPEIVQDELLARAKLLEAFGPELGRPHADTLNASRHPNMKELRFNADDGVWRVAFAFDPDRAAILLVAADKAGVKERRFYRRLIKLAVSDSTNICKERSDHGKNTDRQAEFAAR